MERTSRFRRFACDALDILGGLLVVAACLGMVYEWDRGRVFVKRVTVSDETLYEIAEPGLRAQDPGAFIHIGDSASLAAARARVVRTIWGDDGLPSGTPDSVVREVEKAPGGTGDCPSGPHEPLVKKLRCEAGRYAGWDNLAGIDALHVRVGSDSIPSAYESVIAYFRPHRANGTLVVYQHGYAGTYHAQHRNLERLVAAGFTVAASSLANYGDNDCPERPQAVWCLVSAGTFEVPLPLRVHFTPLAKAVNFALADRTIRDVAMIGFSAGAWVTAVMAAADPRITRSYPVAGVMPAYLRRDKEHPPLLGYPPLLEAAGMLDLFVLGAAGEGRRQVQVFNRYDRCCYNGVRPLLYEPAVREAVARAGGGSFTVLLDESHARHKVSGWTFDRILADLAATGRAP